MDSYIVDLVVFDPRGKVSKDTIRNAFVKFDILPLVVDDDATLRGFEMTLATKEEASRFLKEVNNE